jgi:hypothetical protein
MLANLGGKADAYPRLVERHFPRILARLVDLWDSPEADAYLSSLLVADRTDRSGFPDDVVSELFRLSTIHGMLRPEDTQNEDGWLTDSEVSNFFGRRADR